MQSLSSELIDSARIDYMQTSKMHTFHGSEFLAYMVTT